MIEVEPIILFWAFRYALGRRSYAVKMVADVMIEHRKDFDTTMNALIRAEIDEAVSKGYAGDSFDVQTWLHVRDILARGD